MLLSPVCSSIALVRQYQMIIALARWYCMNSKMTPGAVAEACAGLHMQVKCPGGFHLVQMHAYDMVFSIWSA